MYNHSVGVENNVFIIMGCQRTGTTLLKLILESHPQIFVHGEMTSYDLFCGNQSYQQGTKLVGLQLNLMMEQVPLFSDIKHPIITTRRDPVDVIASMYGNNLISTNIVHYIEMKMLGDLFFQGQMETECLWLGEFEKGTKEYEAAYAVVYYKYRCFLINNYIKLKYPVCVIDYEELVNNPEYVIKTLCQFLKIEYDDRLLQHHILPHTEILSNGRTAGKTYPNLPIHTQSVGRGYSVLTKEQIEVIKKGMEIGFKVE